MGRRDALLASVVLASGVAPRAVHARGRLALGGTLSLRVPWSLAAIDPHRLDDAASLFFGGCLFDSLFGVDAVGGVVPVLAEALPELSPEGVRVTLREGLRFGSGRSLAARDVVASLARARSLDARGWLDPVGTVRVARGPGPLAGGTLIFGGRAADRVARALASPLASIVPERFVPEQPEGTGPFVALPLQHAGDARVLTQNRFAARGPSVLDHISVAQADDLAASLRAFESGEDDLGWLGLGLHEPRRNAVPFDAGCLGWAILRTGDEVGRWSLPGVAQRLADGIDPARLAHLGVVADWTVEPDEGWGGPPVPLLVRSDAPWLVELARALAAALSRPDHDVTLRPVPPAELLAARASRAYSLAVDLARPFDSSPLGTYAALAAADDPVRGAELARHPPLGAAAGAPRAVGRFLRVGVVAGVRLAGGRMPDLILPPGPAGLGVDFGSITHPHPRVL